MYLYVCVYNIYNNFQLYSFFLSKRAKDVHVLPAVFLQHVELHATGWPSALVVKGKIFVRYLDPLCPWIFE